MRCESRCPALPDTCFLLYFNYIRLSTTVRIRNEPANHFVASASLASRDFALFFARYDSFWPVNAERPEFLPDCRIMMHIRATLMRSWIIRNIIFNTAMSGQFLSWFLFVLRGFGLLSRLTILSFLILQKTFSLALPDQVTYHIIYLYSNAADHWYRFHFTVQSILAYRPRDCKHYFVIFGGWFYVFWYARALWR